METTEHAFAHEVVRIARGEIGRGESGRNNGGPDVVRYRRGVDDGGAWCASFVSWCLEEAAAALGVRCPVRRSAGAKWLFSRVLDGGGVRLELPEVGAVVLWHRGAVGAATGHVGIVSAIGDGGFCSVEGNRGPAAKVKEFRHALVDPMLLGFARLPAVQAASVA